MFIRIWDPTITALNTYNFDHTSWVLQTKLIYRLHGVVFASYLKTVKRVNFCTLPRKNHQIPSWHFARSPICLASACGRGVRKSWGQPQVTMAVSKSWPSTAGWFGVPMSRNFHFASSSWLSYMGMNPTSSQYSPLPCVPGIPTPNLNSPVHPLSFSALLVGWGYGMLWDSKTM